MATAARLPPTSTRRLKTHSGSTGSGARRSTSTNATSATAPTMKTAKLTGEPQSHATPPSSSPRMSSENPAVSSADPARSSWCRVLSTCSWKLRHSIHAATPPSGMLMKKIHRQVRYSENSPPRVGPTTAATPQTLAT